MRSTTHPATVLRSMPVSPTVAMETAAPVSFSYVGACQLGAIFHIVASWLASWRARVAQALPQPERSVPASGVWPQDSILASTSKRPRRGHSAIRVREDVLPTHEITCGRIDAHSHLRALAVEALAHKIQSGCRAPILASRSR